MLDPKRLRQDAAEARRLSATVHDEALRSLLIGAAIAYDDMAGKLEAAAARPRTRRARLDSTLP